MSLAACMIVKNEEELLPQCLDSVKDVVDEIVIVDTGSTDKTVEIAESYGARVYYFPWNDSFSDARNESLKHVESDWILVIDADEKLEEKDVPVLMDFIKRAEGEWKQVNAGVVTFLNHNMGGMGKHEAERVFRKGTIRFEGIIHNQAKYEGNPIRLPINIHHYGYSKERMDAKADYRATLLEKAIAEEPYSPFWRYNLLRMYRALERWDDIITQGLEYFDLVGRGLLEKASQAEQLIRLDMSTAYRMMEKQEDAEKLLLELVEQYPLNIDGYYFLGELYGRQEKHEQALQAYDRYLKAREVLRNTQDHDPLIRDTWGSSMDVYNNMAVSFFATGMIEDALVCIRITRKERGKNSQHRLNWITMVKDIMHQAIETYFNLGEIETGGEEPEVAGVTVESDN